MFSLNIYQHHKHLLTKIVIKSLTHATSQFAKMRHASKRENSTKRCSEFFELQNITRRYRSICITSRVFQSSHLASMSFLVFINDMTVINCFKLTFADGIKIFCTCNFQKNENLL